MSQSLREKEDGEIREAARNDNLSHLFFANDAVGDDRKDSPIIDLIHEQFQQENVGIIQPNPAIASLGPNRIKQMVLGPSHVGILLDDDNVCRIPFQVLRIPGNDIREAETTRGDSTRRCEEYIRGGAEIEVIPMGGMGSMRAATSNAKYRRVMLSNSLRAYYRLRGSLGEARSYLLGSSRSSVPASSVPEELINNVQQVLQGKSREVIIRELQRTGLNVNEAVNNLLSRDDGDDGEALDLAGEHLIPEELIQILEGSGPPGSGSSSALTESFLDRVLVSEERLMDSLAPRAEIRYHMPPPFGSKKSKSGDKDKRKKEADPMRNSMKLGANVEWYCGEPGLGIPEEARREEAIQHEDNKLNPVIGIASTTHQLYVLHKNGKVYQWAWKDEKGSEVSMEVCTTEGYSQLGTTEDPAVQISCSNLRFAVLTRSGHLSTRLDERGVGTRMAFATEVVVKIPEESALKIEDFVTSDHLAAFRIGSILHWCGIVPLMESTKAEKEKTERDKKKHVSFGETTVSTGPPAANNSDFHVGQLVQLKKAPLYPAGSVAAHLETSSPMIGVLLEDCWSMHDQCRFRTLTPGEYDSELKVEGFCQTLTEQVAAELDGEVKSTPPVVQSRKRTHEDDSQRIESGRRRCETWSVQNLIWIHEHRKRDVLTVSIADNNLVAVSPAPRTGIVPIFQSVYSDHLDLDSLPAKYPSAQAKPAEKLRLMKREDLQIVDKGPPRAPVILQSTLMKFDVDPHRTVVSMVADLNEFRVLARTKHADLRGLHMYRVSTTGKVLSRRRVPIFLPAVERPIPDALPLKLISFGDTRTLFLRDSAGQLIPLQRDALNGFREPPAMHSQPIMQIAVAWRPSYNMLSSIEKKPQWYGSMLILPGVNRPWHNKFIKNGSSLMQLVLFCDSDGVNMFLDRMYEMRITKQMNDHEYRQTMNEQLFTITSDLGCNVLHAAVRLAIAFKNSEDADLGTQEPEYFPMFPKQNEPFPPVDVVMAEEQDEQGQGTSSAPPAEGEGNRWGRVLRSRPKKSSDNQSSSKKKKRDDKKAEADEIEESTDNSSFSSTRSDETGMPFGSPRPQSARQKCALQIVETLLTHPAVFYDKNAGEDVEYLDEKERLSAVQELMRSRDINGLTPFQSAINLRAYGAANFIWRTLIRMGVHFWTEEQKLPYIFPSYTKERTHNANDSPLFVICYNDVCSFTWTGEDHINQDIYECKTCGLTGSLCCCSECALTCHRNHDCRLKRTSPTAYCDCWEKVNCRALICGNQNIRTYLLQQLLSNTRLYELPNAKDEHLLLFLARTVIRQIREQQYAQKRRGRYRQASTTPGVPEHNLHPPRFAKLALEICCRDMDVVLSAIKFGHTHFQHMKMAGPRDLHYLQQSSATHIDKLCFALSNKSLKEYSKHFITSLRSTLTGTLTEEAIRRHGDMDVWVTRFVRGCVRVLTLAVNISPLGPNTILTGEDVPESTQQPRDPRDPREDRIRISSASGATFQVFNSLISSKKENSKLTEKSTAFVSMINRIMHFLQQLPTYSVVQLATAADAIFEPVRDGLLRPMVNPVTSGTSQDPMDVLEKFYATDMSIDEVMKAVRKDDKFNSSATKQEGKRTRRHSRRDTDRENTSDNRESLEDERSAGDRTSESQETVRVRTESTATSVATAPRRMRLLSGNTTNDTNEDNEERTGQVRVVVGESSSSSEDDDDDEDNDDDDDDDNDDEDVDNDDDDNENNDNDSDNQEDEPQEEEDPHRAVEEQAVAEQEINVLDRPMDVDPEANPLAGDEWQAYEPGSPSSPRQPDFEDNSSDSQEAAPARGFVLSSGGHLLEVIQNSQNAARAAVADNARPAEEGAPPQEPIMSFRGRDISHLQHARRVRESRMAQRLAQYYPSYRAAREALRESSRAGSTASSGNASGSQPAASAQPTATSGSSSTTVPPAAGTSAAPPSQDSSPGSNSSKKGAAEVPCEQPSMNTARDQLALTFCVLVRAGCDILSTMPRPVQDVHGNDDDKSKQYQQKAQRVFAEILEESFRWMGRVLESTEAKLKFNETYERALVFPFCPPAEDKRGRKDSLSYLNSLMRLATNEAKDSTAHIDVEMLYSVALVADAYFYFLNCNSLRPIELKQLIDLYEDCERRKFRQKCEKTDRHLMIGFFARPQSLCWPGYLTDGAWDTISGRFHINRTLTIEEDCPMIGGPKILTMQSKRTDLFRDPQLDDAQRSTKYFKSENSQIADPVEQFTVNITGRPFEYRSPGLSMSIVPLRQMLEHDFIKATRGIYGQPTESDSGAGDFARQAQAPATFQGCGSSETEIEKFKQELMSYSCENGKVYLSRWFKTLGVIGGHFYDRLTESLGGDAAFEHSIVLRNLATFETKHKLFNKTTEKYRAQYSSVKEISLDVRRDSGSLFRATLFTLQNLYNKKLLGVRPTDIPMMPLAGTRLRVHFSDEPGEGTGVTRSFYTAFAEACMMPNSPFETIAAEDQVEAAKVLLCPRSDFDHDTIKNVRRVRRDQSIRISSHIHKLKTFPLNLSAPRFDIKEYTGEGNWTRDVLQESPAESQPISRFDWGDNEEIIRKIHTMTSLFVSDDRNIGRVIGMLFQLEGKEFRKVIDNDDTMRLHIQQVIAELRAAGEFDDTLHSDGRNLRDKAPEPPRNDEQQWEYLMGPNWSNEPLFEKAPYGELYVPVIGNESPLRLACFRTVGRIMGICLSQGDIFPMRFARHVFSYILKEPICWLDLGFYDPSLFNNLRGLLMSDFDKADNEYDFVITEQGTSDKPVAFKLRPDAEKTIVKQSNVLEYVYKYADRVLIGKHHAAFEAIREGVLDVIPESALNGLTPEDLRLIICGIESVSIKVLQENTTFLDESRATQEVLARFKQWFWQVIDAFTPQEKQDLVFFWTGSPSLPAAGKWQSAATVMLRPQEDVFLPTANTCISRIYVPVYSSKRILKSKLLIAIKAKNFGFV